MYADDTQLYADCSHAVDRLECCIDKIREWMTNNFLKLNDSKTECI